MNFHLHRLASSVVMLFSTLTMLTAQPCAHAAEGGTAAGAAVVGLASLPTAVANQPSERYLDGLKQTLGQALHYPNSREARALRPDGELTLRLQIDRSGRLLDAAVAEGSSVRLLDAEALRAVRLVRFKPFGSDADTDESSRQFLVHVHYQPEGFAR